MENETKNVTVIVGGTLINGTGKPPLKHAIIIIEGCRIKDVGEDTLKIPCGAKKINAVGKTVMPGLIDCHVHLAGIRGVDSLVWKTKQSPSLRTIRAIMDAQKILDVGFTSIRDAGSDRALAVKEAIEKGIITGPRIILAGLGITQMGGFGDQDFMSGILCTIADGIDECRKKVRQQIRKGANVIKIFATGSVGSQKAPPELQQFTMNELKAMVEEAHRKGVKVMAHAEGLEGAKNAVMVGVDTIEHGYFLDDEICRMMIEKEIIYVPTLCACYRTITKGKKYGISQSELSRTKKVFEKHIESLKRAHKAGVKIAAGSDTYAPPLTQFGKNSQELELMVTKGGLSPMEAVLAATKTAAEVLGLEKTIGTIERSKMADIIIVKGNPLENIKILQEKENIWMIFKDGKIVKEPPNGFYKDLKYV